MSYSLRHSNFVSIDKSFYVYAQMFKTKERRFNRSVCTCKTRVRCSYCGKFYKTRVWAIA